MLMPQGDLIPAAHGSISPFSGYEVPASPGDVTLHMPPNLSQQQKTKGKYGEILQKETPGKMPRNPSQLEEE